MIDLIEEFLEKEKKYKNNLGNTEDQKCIKVAFAGVPNAGKSSLMNKLIGEKISIVSPKVQTTRDVIRGILIEGNTEIIIIDTPGIFIPKESILLERKIVKTAWSGIRDSDVVFVIIDASEGINSKVKNLIESLKGKHDKINFILNKVDLVSKPKLLELASKIQDIYPDFDKLFMVSAKKGDNLDKLKKYLIEIAPKCPWIFRDDEVTDAPMKFLASEITREKLFNELKNDLPYSVDVETEKWEDFDNGDIKIHQIIRVFKESQKAIVLGKGGQRLKKVGEASKNEISKFFGRKVHLYLFVQVNEKWVENKFHS